MPLLLPLLLLLKLTTANAAVVHRAMTSEWSAPRPIHRELDLEMYVPVYIAIARRLSSWSKEQRGVATLALLTSRPGTSVAGPSASVWVHPPPPPPPIPRSLDAMPQDYIALDQQVGADLRPAGAGPRRPGPCMYIKVLGLLCPRLSLSLTDWVVQLALVTLEQYCSSVTPKSQVSKSKSRVNTTAKKSLHSLDICYYNWYSLISINIISSGFLYTWKSHLTTLNVTLERLSNLTQICMCRAKCCK